VFIVGVVSLSLAITAVMLRPPATPATALVPQESVAGATQAPSDPPMEQLSAITAPPMLSAVESPPATPAPTRAPLTGYVWPLKNAMVTLPFGTTDWGEWIVDGKRFHDGLDIATFCGDYVLAAHDGTVLAASRQYDDYLGWVESLKPYYDLLDRKKWWSSLPIVIVIDDGNGYRSIYAHEYKVTVKPGQHVTAGQVIGYEGQTGNASGCHVHYGLFDTAETATFAMNPDVVAKNYVPAHEIARVDPLLVLPFRCEVEEQRVLRPAEAVGCGPLPTPTPKH
jgi:murein DD-endopeptidase MepM/ murein hydrolase activator NlpD